MPTSLTHEQAEERLKSPKNLVERFGGGAASVSEVEIIQIERSGRNDGSLAIPEADKINMAVRRNTGEKLQSIANDYGVVPSVVHNIANGKTKANRKKIDELTELVQDTALLKLMSSLNLISDEKLNKLSAKDLGVFASSMSKVIGNTKERDESEARVQVHIYAPEIRQEHTFKTIEVRG